MYGRAPQVALWVAQRFAPVYRLLANRYWIDEFYEAMLLRPVRGVAQGLAWFDYHVLDQVGVDGVGWVTQQLARAKAWVDRVIIDGLVDLWGTLVNRGGDGLRQLQTGRVQNYLLVLSLGLVAMALWRLI